MLEDKGSADMDIENMKVSFFAKFLNRLTQTFTWITDVDFYVYTIFVNSVNKINSVLASLRDRGSGL